MIPTLDVPHQTVQRRRSLPRLPQKRYQEFNPSLKGKTLKNLLWKKSEKAQFHTAILFDSRLMFLFCFFILSFSTYNASCRKKFSERYFSHFQIDWMLLLRYCFAIFHIDLNLGLDTPNKVTNQSPAALDQWEPQYDYCWTLC